jgi:hypothetical protein
MTPEEKVEVYDREAKAWKRGDQSLDEAVQNISNEVGHEPREVRMTINSAQERAVTQRIGKFK